MSVNLKICGISRIEDIKVLNEVLPTYVGFVFTKSKREIDKERAILLKKELDPRIKTVGIFVNAPLDTIEDLFSSQIIDLVQLHGEEDNSYIFNLKQRINVDIIKAIKMNKTSTFNYPSATYLLLDSSGGSGKPFDWKTLPQLDKPIFIAGGISTNNIEDAINIFNPYAVDVSSSIETDGYKDEQKIRELCKKLRDLNGEI